MAYRSDGKIYFGGSDRTKARSATAAIAVDSATLTDANYPTAVDPTTGGPIDCTGLETILVGVAITAGTNPGMTIEALFRDGNAADGLRWVRRVNGSGAITTPSLVPGQEAELYVDGHDSVYLRCSAVANAASTTAWAIYARPGKRSRARPPAGR